MSKIPNEIKIIAGLAALDIIANEGKTIAVLLEIYGKSNIKAGKSDAK